MACVSTGCHHAKEVDKLARGLTCLSYLGFGYPFPKVWCLRGKYKRLNSHCVSETSSFLSSSDSRSSLAFTCLLCYAMLASLLALLVHSFFGFLPSFSSSAIAMLTAIANAMVASFALASLVWKVCTTTLFRTT